MRMLDAYINGILIGKLSTANDIWAFEYTQAWALYPNGFDLSPQLPRINPAMGPSLHHDDATIKPVQWFFENLLPGIDLRTLMAKEAKLPAEDSFGLLEHYGQESAGAITLTNSKLAPQDNGAMPLYLNDLSDRIKRLPHGLLITRSYKPIIPGGDQLAMAVIYVGGELYEPMGQMSSTHILKTQHFGNHEYPESVVNEYFTMRVAQKVGLNIVSIQRFFCPQPLSLIERYDRFYLPNGEIQRLHAIDGCQLLNLPRQCKYSSATIETLASIIKLLRRPDVGKHSLYDWLVFNILVGNGRCHLKNISFLISQYGIDIAPFYNLLSTAAYRTSTTNPNEESWPQTQFAISFPSGKKRFCDIKRQDIIDAGITLGLSSNIAELRLKDMTQSIFCIADLVKYEINQENHLQPKDVQRNLHTDDRVMRIIRHHIIRKMVAQLK